MKSAVLGPWPKGYVNAVDAQAIPDDGLFSAENVDIDRDGSVSSRASWVRLASVPAASLFEFAGRSYGVVNNEVGEISAAGFRAMATVTPPVAWAVLNGAVAFVDFTGLYVLQNGAFQQAYVDVRADEAELMLAPMPGGSWLDYWQGRALVVRGNSIFFSEPLRFGVYDRMRSFMQFEERVTWVAPLEQGIYVGLRNSVRFLAGGSPLDMKQTVVAGRSWAGSGTTMTTEHMDPGMTQNANRVAVWMGSTGFAVGLPSGDVVFPQADRLKDIPESQGNMVVLGDRITVLSN